MTYDHWKTTEPDPFEFDKTPQIWVECGACNGEGFIAKRVTVYEHGCGFPHYDTDEVRCEQCNGTGGWIDDVEHDQSIENC